ncbi:MAG: curli assembly protein CsgF [Sulfitobacter sp.]
MFSARLLYGLSAAALIAGAATPVAADLIYRPQIPAFGGNPDNWGYLLGSAQIQNQYAPESDGGGGGAPDITFPPIVIDLGGVGGGATPPAAPPAATTPATTGGGTTTN